MKKALLAVLLCACASERSDVEALCQAPVKVSTENPALTATLLARQLKGSVKSAEGTALLHSLFAAEPSERPGLMVAAAKKNGLSSCPLVEVLRPALAAGR